MWLTAVKLMFKAVKYFFSPQGHIEKQQQGQDKSPHLFSAALGLLLPALYSSCSEGQDLLWSRCVLSCKLLPTLWPPGPPSTSGTQALPGPVLCSRVPLLLKGSVSGALDARRSGDNCKSMLPPHFKEDSVEGWPPSCSFPEPPKTQRAT